MIKRFKKIWIGAAIICSSVFALSLTEDNSYFEITKNLDIFATLFRELNTYYVDNTDPNKLMKEGIEAMLESLDPYTDFYPESEIEDYRMMTTGTYGGIGAQIRQRGDYIMISEPYEGYAALKADLRAGDIILEVDGKSIKGKKNDDVSKILKGQAKTTIKLVIKREGEPKPIEKSFVREDVKIKSVPYSGVLNESIGYIKLTGFTENAGSEVKEAFTKLKEKNNLTGLVLDLRDNPGGLLNEAVNISNVFIDKGQDVVSTRGKVKEWDKVYKAINPPVDVTLPIVVLVNSGSASASEIVTGSLQDLDRAVIVGERTFGKGLVQTTRPLSYNTQLKLTTAKYYIPSGRCIQAINYSNRNADGSVGKVPDSLMSVFKTKNGRQVYDGGGIIPDIKSEEEQISPITLSLLTKFLIVDYATQYKSKHASIPSVTQFSLTDADFKDFIAYIADKEYDYTTESERALEQLKKSTENEKYFTAINSEYDALKAKMGHNKKADLEKNKAQIMQFLKEEIASRYYYAIGRIESKLNYDPEIKKALEILKDKEQYAAVLSGKYQDPAISEYFPKKEKVILSQFF